MTYHEKARLFKGREIYNYMEKKAHEEAREEAQKESIRDSDLDRLDQINQKGIDYAPY